MIGSLIGAVAGIGASIFGAVSASKAMRQAKREIAAQKEENTNNYLRRYNEDATQRADAQRMLNTMREEMLSRNRAAAATQAVMGGTDESVAAAKEASAKAMAETSANIAASAASQKDAIERQYQARQDSLNAQLNQMRMNKANATVQAAQGVAQAAGTAGLSYDEWQDARRDQEYQQSVLKALQNANKQEQ